MALSWAFFALAVVWIASTLNALRPPRIPFTEVGSFFAGWFVSELPLVHLVLQACATGLFVWGGALGNWPGDTAAGLAGASWIGLIVLEASSWKSRSRIDAALSTLPGGAAPLDGDIPWVERRMPIPVPGKGVERLSNVDYWGDGIGPHRLDIYRPRETPSRSTSNRGSPVMVYIHGGAWILGDKREQGRPMIHHLARKGWLCVSVNYRLSPRANWPDAVVDCKRAIAWIKEHAADYGGDPNRLVISGGSAGGHLAALVALSAGHPEWQPGFEEADTSVSACIPFYGVFDFTNTHRAFHPFFVRFLERMVMKSKLSENRRLFEEASPYWRVHPEAPPFLIVAGRNDTLVPIEEPRRFVEKLREISRQPVCYIELPFAQHAFEIFPSVRSTFMIRAVEPFAASLFSPARSGG